MNELSVGTILALPLDQWDLDKETCKTIMNYTECTKMRDLWELSAKELCLYCGLTKNQLVGLIAKTKNLNYRAKHVDYCDRTLRMYWNSITD